jgi:hypothetical protein
VPQLAQFGERLGPAERFLDALANALRDRVAGLSGGAAVKINDGLVAPRFRRMGHIPRQRGSRSRVGGFNRRDAKLLLRADLAESARGAPPRRAADRRGATGKQQHTIRGRFKAQRCGQGLVLARAVACGSLEGKLQVSSNLGRGQRRQMHVTISRRIRHTVLRPTEWLPARAVGDVAADPQTPSSAAGAGAHALAVNRDRTSTLCNIRAGYQTDARCFCVARQIR